MQTSDLFPTQIGSLAFNEKWQDYVNYAEQRYMPLFKQDFDWLDEAEVPQDLSQVDAELTVSS